MININNFWTVFIITVFLLVSGNQTHSQEFDDDRWVRYCNKLYDENNWGNAQLRKCIREHRNIEASTLKSKACNREYCLYKLEYSRKIPRGNDWATYIYKGSGYAFYYLDEIETTLIKHTDGIYHAARLIDGNGQQTIVAQCGGSSCGGYFEYDHGPLRGAELRGAYGGANYEDQYWVLTLPR